MKERRYEVFGFNGSCFIRDTVTRQRTENRFSKEYANRLASCLENSFYTKRECLIEDIEIVE